MTDLKYCPHCNGLLDGENRELVWGGWRFDEGSGMLILPAVIHFTPVEARLVGALLRAAGRVCGQQSALFAALCADRPDSDWPDFDIVNVYVSKIRGKLRRYNLHMIETVWGSGYRAVPYAENPTFSYNHFNKRKSACTR